MQVGIFNCLFIFVIAALNDYVIVASIIVIAIRNLINCAALLDSIAFVWSRYPPVFSPQTGRSTESQPDVVERPVPGPHSMNPWEPVEGWVPYVET